MVGYRTTRAADTLAADPAVSRDVVPPVDAVPAVGNTGFARLVGPTPANLPADGVDTQNRHEELLLRNSSHFVPGEGGAGEEALSVVERYLPSPYETGNAPQPNWRWGEMSESRHSSAHGSTRFSTRWRPTASRRSAP
jgi:hypothetical protein